MKKYLFSIVGFLSFATSVIAQECPLVASDAVIWRNHYKIRVENIFDFKSKPKIGSETTVLPYPQGKPVALKITSAKFKRIENVESYWEVSLEDASHTSLKDIKPTGHRNPDFPSDVVVLWPAKDKARIAKIPAALPRNVYRKTVKTAIDLDSNDKADILIVEFNCRHRNESSAKADLTCGETWQKTNNKWILCSSFTPL